MKRPLALSCIPYTPKRLSSSRDTATSCDNRTLSQITHHKNSTYDYRDTKHRGMSLSCPQVEGTFVPTLSPKQRDIFGTNSGHFRDKSGTFVPILSHFCPQKRGTKSGQNWDNTQSLPILTQKHHARSHRMPQNRLKGSYKGNHTTQDTNSRQAQNTELSEHTHNREVRKNPRTPP